MTAERLLMIFSIMERAERDHHGGIALCDVAAEFLDLDGAGIALTRDNEDLMSLCTSNDTATALMNLELTLGEGPATDACRGNIVEEANLLNSASRPWNTYRSEAVELGAQAVFGYPIQLGAVRFGALSLFRRITGPLSGGQSSDGYLMASVIGRAILATQAGGSQETLVGELEGKSVLDFRVHQAAGMIAIQGSMSVKDALVMLRAHAFATKSPLTEFADRVVVGMTRFELATRTWSDE